MDKRLIGYKTEIGGVEDYEGFYAANRGHKAFNETTSNFRTDRRYYIVYTDSVDTEMEKSLYKKYEKYVSSCEDFDITGDLYLTMYVDIDGDGK